MKHTKGFAIVVIAIDVLFIGIQCEKSVPDNKQLQSQNKSDLVPYPSWVTYLVKKYSLKPSTLNPAYAKQKFTDSATAAAYLASIQKKASYIDYKSNVSTSTAFARCNGLTAGTYHATVQDFRGVSLVAGFNIDLDIGYNQQTDEVFGMTGAWVTVTSEQWGWNWTALSAFILTPGGNGWGGCIHGMISTSISFGLWTFTKDVPMDFYVSASSYNCTLVTRWGSNACSG
jgi:hypothetical protein